MKPSSSTQRSSSSTQFAGETPGDWGSMHTGAKFWGYSVQTRWIRSFCTRAHCALMAASPTWCSMEPARGEKKVTSLPRSVVLERLQFALRGQRAVSADLHRRTSRDWGRQRGH
jgi:hypothetical protein